MPVSPLAFVLSILVAAGLPGAALLWMRRRWRAEARRADSAETRSQSYLSVVEALTRALSDKGSALPDLPEMHAAPAPPRAAPPAPEETARPGDSRYLFVSFEEEIRRAQQRGQPLTVLTLDLGSAGTAKSLKEPHLADRILRSVARAVRGQMRGCDTCIRYAGHEFILILPGVSREEARRVEGRLRTAVQGVALEPRAGVAIRIRPCLGSATCPDDGQAFDQLLSVADVRRSQDLSREPDGPERRPLTFPLQHPAHSRN